MLGIPRLVSQMMSLIKLNVDWVSKLWPNNAYKLQEQKSTYNKTFTQ